MIRRMGLAAKLGKKLAQSLAWRDQAHWREREGKAGASPDPGG
jgi:hypothetical protein